MEKLRLLFLNGDLPVFPGWGGVEYLHTTGLARLAQRVGVVSLAHSREQQEKKRGLVDAGVALYLWESANPAGPSGPGGAARRSVARRRGQALYDTLRNWQGRPRDTLVQDLQFRNISASLLRALGEDRWQVLVVVQSSSARWLEYLPRFPVSVLVLHDIRALLYERQARAASWLGARLARAREARRYRRFERRYCSEYDLVITVSRADEAWVRRHYRPARVLTIPIPVDAEYFAPLPGVREAPARILFTGMMAHPPNEDAACFFARDVLPEVQAAIPEAEFWIVGRDPTPRVKALGGLPGVVVMGLVPDMRPYLAQATVVVVPLRFGSGMRQKILEAWAMERCVVSTRVGAEGLDVEDGVNILLADEPGTLARSVIRALRDPRLRDEVRSRGRAVVAGQHDPPTLTRLYYETLAAVAREKRQGAGPMRAVIDLRWMTPGVAGGIENLSRSLLNQLLALDRFNRYTVLLPSEARYDFDLRGHPNFKAVVADGPGHYIRSLLTRGARLLLGRVGATYWRTPEVEALGRARTLEAEVALSIPGYIHPDVAPLANVLIVPDIQHEYHPEFFSSEELEGRRRIYTDSARRATHLCAISEFTRQSLIERLGIPADRITTTHLAADPLFHPGSASRGDPGRVLDRHGLKAGDYLFFPGNTWPHKNHRTALEALRVLRDAYGLEPLLVCTGSPKGAHEDLLVAIRDLGLQGRVRFLGYCPTPDMPGLYEGAAALVFPSLFEGFGLPLLEAMWCDCPIVCSNLTSLPEIAGDAALLVDPGSPEELAHALNRVLTDDGLRHTLIARGRERVARFSWVTFALEIVRALDRVWRARYG